MRRIIVLATGVAAALVVAMPVAAGGGGCHADFTDAPSRVIELRLNCFGPTVARIQAGDTVTWRNFDDSRHNVYSQGFTGSGVLSYDQTHTARFDQPGVFPFVCTIHPGMMGAVVVTATPTLNDTVRTKTDIRPDEPLPAVKPVKTEAAPRFEAAQPAVNDPTEVVLDSEPETAVDAPAVDAVLAAPLTSQTPDDAVHGVAWLIGAAILAVGIVLAPPPAVLAASPSRRAPSPPTDTYPAYSSTDQLSAR